MNVGNIVQIRQFSETVLSNPDVEMYLVATAMSYPSHWHEVSYVRQEDFTDPFAGQVWTAIKNLILSGRKPEPHTVAGEIYQNDEDRKKCATSLIEWLLALVSFSSGPEYARIIKDLSERRRILRSAQELIEMAQDTSCGLNAAEIASRGVGALVELQEDGSDFVSAHEISEGIIKSLDKSVPVSKTGFDRFDKAMGGGFYRGRYYGLGARMKSGKSLFMSTIAYNMTVHQNSKILYLCLEMGSAESMQRILSMHMNINALKFQNNEIRNQEWFRKRVGEAKEAFKDKGLFFRSKPRMTLEDLKATIARAGMSGKFDGIIVDYLQLVEGKLNGQSTAEHFDNVAQTLAEAVKRYPIWILSAAQLNKEGSVRSSEGLLMACDLAFSINKKEGSLIMTNDGERKEPDTAWLETMVSRYTPYMDIGSQEVPGYEICVDRGPSFVEL